MNPVRINYRSPQLDGQSILWKGEMQRPGSERAEVYFHFTCPAPQGFVPFIRPFVLAFLVPAMRIGLPVQLEQPLDQTTLDNLMEWQEAMASWRPGILKVVPIRCDVAPSPFQPGAGRATSLTAFSGGVDSCFTALRHSPTHRDRLGRRTRLRAGLMIHGFDIPESEPETFLSAFRRSRRILENLGLQSYRLKTNLRHLEKVFGCDWEYETHGIWLAATLACLEPFFSRTLIPSSYPYHLPVLPWGSNTMTDPLFASDENNLWHDGAAFDKFDKVRAFARHPVIQENLRVCWEGAQLDRNCGQCFKCVTTQACFWASGVPHPKCFNTPCSTADAGCLKLKKHYDRYWINQLREECLRQGNTELATHLKRTLNRDRRKALLKLLKHPSRIIRVHD